MKWGVAVCTVDGQRFVSESSLKSRPFLHVLYHHFGKDQAKTPQGLLIQLDPNVSFATIVIVLSQQSRGFVSSITEFCVSVCPRLTLGDWAGSLALGELSWPLVYGVAVDLLGSDLVHRYVGTEGYSRYDSPFTLTKAGPAAAILLNICTNL